MPLHVVTTRVEVLDTKVSKLEGSARLSTTISIAALGLSIGTLAGIMFERVTDNSEERIDASYQLQDAHVNLSRSITKEVNLQKETLEMLVDVLKQKGVLPDE